MEEINNGINDLREDKFSDQKPISQKLILLIIIVVSLIAGMTGGVYGALNLAKRPEFQKLFNHAGVASNNQALNQSIVLNEDSAITDVVKKTSPAVVSIVISKDVANVFPFFGQQRDRGQKRLYEFS